MTGISGRAVFGIFTLVVVLSTALSFFGYAVLQRASALQKANYLQRDATVALLVTIQRTQSLESAARRLALSGRLRALMMDAAWCRSSGSVTEAEAIRLLVGDELFALCRRTEELLQASGRYLVNAGGAPGSDDYALGAMANRLILASETADLIFPVLDRLEQVAARAVRVGTAGVAVLLLIIGALAVQLRQRTLARLRETEEKRAREQTRFRRAIHDAKEGLGVLDTSGALVEWNSSFAEVFEVENLKGRLFKDVLGDAASSGRLIDIRSGATAVPTDSLAERIMEGTEVEIRFSKGRSVRLSSARVEGGDGVVVVAADQTEIYRQKEELRTLTERLSATQEEARHQAYHDSLTGLANRRAFDNALENMENSSCTLVRIDLDHFKYVNDTFGHDAGDKVLKHVAKILKKTTADQKLAARIGGDEFVIVCGNGVDLAGAETLSAEISRHIRKPLHYQGRLCHFGASFGSASNLDLTEPMSPRAVLAAADVALYRAKQAGRDASVLYTPALHQEIVAQRRLADDLLLAIEEKTFIPYYQPQVDAKSGALAGVEVLARWPRSDGAILVPPKFLPIAEQMRKVSDIDRAIFSRVREDMVRLSRLGTSIPKLAFNVSADRLRDDSLATGIASLVDEGVRVAVELLETVLLEDIDEQLEWHLDRLREIGARIEVDDFGSGHASVMALYRVRPDCLKIDRRIVAATTDEHAGSGAHVVLKAVVEIGKALDTEIIAEGVETLAMAERLTSLGVDTLQGYYFARPLPFEGLTSWISDQAIRTA